MGDLVSGTKYRGEFEERLTKIIKEVIKNKNIILFIDEVHSMVNAGGAEGAINASDILKPYLARGDIKVIGATTTKEYERFIAKDKALERRFETIEIKEPNLEETKEIILGLKETYQEHHKIKITEENINDIVNLAHKYLYIKKNPDKTIDLLDSVCAHVKRKNGSKSLIKPLEKDLKELIIKKEKYVLNGSFDKALDTCLEINKLEEKINNYKNENNSSISLNDILNVIEAKSNVPMFLNKEEIIKKITTLLNDNIYGETNAIVKLINNLKYIQRKIISNSSKKLWKNDEFRQKMIDLRNAPDSVYQSKEFRDKMSKLVSGCKNPNYNHKWSQEQKAHLSQMRKTNKLAVGTNNPRATAIICLETGEVFDMISNAQIKYGIKSESSLSIALRDKKRLAADMHWRYFDSSLLDDDVRFFELLKALYTSEKCPICSPQTKETFNNRKDFLTKKEIGIKKFKKIYSQIGKYVIDNNEYLYVKDFLSRYT